MADVDPIVGTSIGNHTILAKIGQGGMGAVYVAEHAVLGRRAAVKVLLPEYSNNRELTGRFFNEARATAQLRHRAFVEVFDSGTLPDGSAYLVMEHLAGEDLGARIERGGALSVDETLAIAHAVAEGVGVAHRHGIVHRDLKPDNIFLAVYAGERPGTEQITVKVLDFGIAKLTQAGPGSSSRTNTGALMGTPLFMSPEQCRGAGKVDHRSDIYSLGCILYVMLAGTPPFMKEGFGEIISAHLHEPPPPLRGLVPGVSVEVDALVMRMLAKSADDRPASMDEVGAEIARLRAGPPASRAAGAAAPVAASPAAGGAPGGSAGGTRVLPPSKSRLALSTFGEAAGEVRRRGGSQPLMEAPARRGWPAPLIVAAAVVGAAAVAGGVIFLSWGLPGTGAGGGRSASEASGDRGAPARTTAAGDPEPARTPTQRPATVPPAAAEEPAVDAIAVKPVVTRVTIRLASSPAGAAVVDRETGKALGTTPFTLDFPRDRRPLPVVVRRNGYRAKEIAVTFERDGELSVTLEKRAAGRKAPPGKGDSDSGGGDSDDDLRKL